VILQVYRGAVLAALTMALTIAPLHAQRTTEAETAARSMLEQRVPAFDATQRLVTDYRLSVEQSAGILTRVGFVRSHVAVAAARTLLRDPALAVSSLRAVGYSAVEVTEALLSTGGLLNMSCIDPNGYPAVCGPSGGTVATAMGNLSVAPDSVAYTDSVLTLEGSNIPALFVLIGSVYLTQIEATSQRVRVRLPSTPLSGPLVVRRASDGIKGVLRELYTVIQSPVALNTDLLLEAAVAGAGEEVWNWIAGAAVPEGSCTVNGALAQGAPGSLRSAGSHQGRIRTRLLAAGAPVRLAEGWDRAFQGAWGAYTGLIAIPGLPWYPTFALYAGESAPATANTPTPLGALLSAGALQMSAPHMVPRIVFEVGDVALTDAAKPAIDAFADVIAARFAKWLAFTPVSQVMGSGPVPVRDMGLPVPAGPVVGQCEGTNVLPLASF
jgi:hypothetical protein